MAGEENKKFQVTFEEVGVKRKVLRNETELLQRHNDYY